MLMASSQHSSGRTKNYDRQMSLHEGRLLLDNHGYEASKNGGSIFKGFLSCLTKEERNIGVKGGI